MEEGISVGSDRSAQMLYPMYVMRVPVLLQMTRTRSHQELKLEGLVEVFTSKLEMHATFVSHQWCGRRHPDPDFQQIRVLQRVLEKAGAGELLVGTDVWSRAVYRVKPNITPKQLARVSAGYVWFDYFSVPQPLAPEAESVQHCDLATNLGRAVSCIDIYVECCQLFLVLAPATVHEEGHIIDFQSWKSRGWCRFERMARLLSSAEDTTLLLVRHEDAVYQIGAQDYLFEPVGLGSFTDERDRGRLSARVKRMLMQRIFYLEKTGRLEEFRDLMALRSSLLEGLPLQWAEVSPSSSMERFTQCIPDSARSNELARFMDDFRFTSPTETVGSADPLTYATMLGAAKVMDELLRLRADPHFRMKRTSRACLRQRGYQPIHVAASCGHVAAVDLLLQHRASVDARGGPLSETPLLVFGKSSPACTRLLIERRAGLEIVNALGMGALGRAAAQSHAERVRLLLDAGIFCGLAKNGLNPLHTSAVFGAGADVVGRLIDAGVSLHERIRSPPGTRIWTILGTWSLLHKCGRRGFIPMFGYHCWGATPVMISSMFGHVGQVQLMLKHRGDPELRNNRGLTAFELARAFRPSGDPLLERLERGRVCEVGGPSEAWISGSDPFAARQVNAANFA